MSSNNLTLSLRIRTNSDGTREILGGINQQLNTITSSSETMGTRGAAASARFNAAQAQLLNVSSRLTAAQAAATESTSALAQAQAASAATTARLAASQTANAAAQAELITIQTAHAAATARAATATTGVAQAQAIAAATAARLTVAQTQATLTATQLTSAQTANATATQALTLAENAATAATERLAIAQAQAIAVTARAAAVTTASNTSLAGSTLAAGAATASFFGLKTMLAGFIGVATIGNIIQVNMEMESLRIRLVSVMKDAELANQVFNKLMKLDVTTPFGIQDLTAAFIKLKNFGMEPTDQVMWALTNTVAKLGGGADTLSGVALALGQSWAKAKLQAQDTNQMIERGVPVYEALERVTGRNTVALVKMMEAGELNRDIMAKMLIELGKMADGSNARAMETMAGKASALGNAWTKLTDALLQSKSENAIGKILEYWSRDLDYFTSKLQNTTAEMDKMAAVTNRIAELRTKINFANEHPVLNAFNPLNKDAAQQNLTAAIAEQQRLTAEMAKTKAAIDTKAKAQQDFAAKTKALTDAQSKAAAEQEAYAAFNKKYATDEQKLNIELTEQRKALGALFTKEAEDKIRAVFAHKAANSDAHKEAVKEIKELADLQEAAANAQIKDIQRVNVARLADIESAKKANDNAFQDNKISALAHYQTEMALIEKTAQARIAALREQKTLQSQVSASQLGDLDKALAVIKSIESSGGKLGQVNISYKQNGAYNGTALGTGQAMISTLMNPGHGLSPFQPAINDHIRTFKEDYNKLKAWVLKNDSGLTTFAENYFKALVRDLGSVEKAVQAYGDHTAGYMAKFKKGMGEQNTVRIEAIKTAGAQKDIEAEVAKVQQESNQAKADATRQFLKENETYQKSIAELKIRYIELTGTAEQARAAQLALQNENNPLRKQATAAGDTATQKLLDSVQMAERNKEFNDTLKSLEDEQLQLEMTTREWAKYQNAKKFQDPIQLNIVNKETDKVFDNKAAKKTLEYKISFKDKELTDGLTKAQKLATGLQTSFGKVDAAIGQMAVAYANYGKVSNDIEVQRAAITAENGYNAEQIATAQLKAAQEQAIAQIDAYASMTEAAQNFFKEGTTGYQLMGVATKAFRAYEMYLSSQSTITAIADMARTVGMWVTGEATKTAATVATVAPTVGAAVAKGTANAGVAVTNQGGGDPYTAFARIAMMIALMAAVGFSVGGGGASAAASINLAEERQKTQGTGTVLGDSSAKSKSIANSLELLKSNSDISLPLTAQMASSLRNIESSIGGLGNQVARLKINNPTFTPTTTLGGPQGLNKVFVDILGLFGSKTTSSLADSGLSVMSQSVGNILSSGLMQAQQYMDIQYTKKGGLFGGSKTWTTRQMSAADSELQTQFGKVIGNLATSVNTAAGALSGSNANFMNVLNGFIVNIGDVSLKGLKGADLQAELEAIFGRVGDQMAQYIFPGLDAFQKAGEGYFETLVRVANGTEQASVGLDRLGIKAINYTQVINKQGDVFAEIVRQSIVAQETAAKGIADIIDLMDGTGTDLINTYKQLSDIRDRMLLNGLAGNNLSRSTVTGAGGLSELDSAVKSYADIYFSDAEKMTAAANDMRIQFLKLGLAMPLSTAAYRKLVESIDTSTESGQKFQGQVLALGDAFASANDLATKYLDTLKSNVTTAEDNLRKAYQTQSTELQKAADDFGGFAKSLKEYLDSLVLSDLSTKTPLAKYQESKAQFDAVNVLINTGTDAQKQEGLGKLQGVTQAFLESSRAYNASSMGYVRDFAIATAALNNGVAISTVKEDVSKLQLDALKTQVEKLITLNESVLSVADAIAALTVVQNELKITQDAMAQAAFLNAEAAKTAAEKLNRQNYADSEAKRLSDYNANLLSAAQSQNPLNTIAPNTYVNGQTTDKVWEQVLANANASHQARFGIPMNRAWNADQDAMRVKAILDVNYKEAAIAQNNAAVAATIEALKSQYPFIAQNYDPLKRYAKGGISNVPAIFGEAGAEAAVPLPDGRSIPVTLNAPAPMFQQQRNDNGNDQSKVIEKLESLLKKQEETIKELKQQNELILAGLKIDQFGYEKLLETNKSQAETLESMDRRERAKA